MLEIRNLSKKFGKKLVLDHVGYSFKNSIYGLLGPNDSGKTTFLRFITGLYSAPKDTIIFNGKETRKNKDFLSHIGYLPQNFGMFKELTVKEALEFFANAKNISKKEAHNDITEILKKVNLSNEISKKVGKLSGGMLRRLGIAQALLGNPEILIFDEPTVGLDPEERLRFKNIISNLSKNKIIIISTHIVEDVEALCDQIIIMNSGKILASGTACQIANIARDKVYTLPESELSNIVSEYEIQKQYSENGVQYVRILSNEELNYDKPELSIEDGYMYAIKNHENIF